MNCQAVIFDLDGTLLDTLTDIADAANRALRAHGFSPHERQAYRWFIGDGSAILMARALPESQRTAETVQACLKSFIEDYNQNWHQATRPYDGLRNLLEGLRDRNIKLAVVTNKPHRFAVSMMAHYFGDYPFDPILGQQAGVPKKPHPGQALAAARSMGVRPDRCIFIGDSAVDMETGRNAGMHPVGAGWGFRTPAELMNTGALTVVQHPAGLLDFIDLYTFG
jgi:phosphoglycolate phosphatase